MYPYSSRVHFRPHIEGIVCKCLCAQVKVNKYDHKASLAARRARATTVEAFRCHIILCPLQLLLDYRLIDWIYYYGVCQAGFPTHFLTWEPGWYDLMTTLSPSPSVSRMRSVRPPRALAGLAVMSCTQGMRPSSTFRNKLPTAISNKNLQVRITDYFLGGPSQEGHMDYTCHCAQSRLDKAHA